MELAARGLAVSPAGDTLYVARIGDDRADVAVVDVESGALRAVAVSAVSGASVEALRLSADGTRLFVALTTASGGSLVVIDTTRCVVLRTVALAGSIGEIAAHPNGRKVFATGWDVELGSVITVIDVASARVIDTIGVRGIPTSLVLGHDGDLAYFVDRDEIAVMCTATHEIVDHITVGGALACLAAGPRGRLYAADYSGAITALQVGAASDLALLAS
ncbi:LpqB family beta-propeller domain-containing protein [Mycobacterium sp. M26]|uniref:YncE family protein n=1 Tax=Mycobacterium sp. M26 TaxID=1762962 RepID=UPI00073F1972